MLSLEKRVEVLERELAQLKKLLAGSPPPWSSNTPSISPSPPSHNVVGITFHKEKFPDQIFVNVEPYFRNIFKNNNITNANVYFVFSGGARAEIDHLIGKITQDSIVLIFYAGQDKIQAPPKLNVKTFLFSLDDTFRNLRKNFDKNDAELRDMISYLKSTQQIKSCIICGEKAYLINPSTNQTYCKKTECKEQSF